MEVPGDEDKIAILEPCLRRKTFALNFERSSDREKAFGQIGFRAPLQR